MSTHTPPSDNKPALVRRIQLRLKHGPDNPAELLEATMTASALRGLCALGLVNLVAQVMTMREQEPEGLDEYIPKIDVHAADAALMQTNAEDYAEAGDWLIATIYACGETSGPERKKTDP
jgi:hypothetical protein